MRRRGHYLILAAVLIGAAAIRFSNLDLKFLCIDEVDTTVFSLGRSLNEVPQEVAVPISALDQMFVLNREATYAEIARAVTTEDVHPPVFFCLMHGWLKLVGVSVWTLRALPALLGVLAVAAVYALSRVAFSRAAGLMAAAMMAVSPFAVHLSQEARHYTLPMFLLTLALLALVLIQKEVSERQRVRWPILLAWMVINSIGFYVHYFFVLSFMAQAATLIALIWLQRRTIPLRCWTWVGLAAGAVALSYLPWLSIVMHQVTRSETNWLNLSYANWREILSPPFLALAAMLTMAIVLPVGGQLPWIADPSTLLMILFGLWMAWQLSKGWTQLWRNPDTHRAILILTGITLCVLVEFLANTYILRKNVFRYFRYHTFYYPALCALAGASLAALPSGAGRLGKTRLGRYLGSLSPRRIQGIVLLVGVISSAFVVTDLAAQKPFYYPGVARNLAMDRSSPVLMVVVYKSSLDVILGLSYMFEVRKLQSKGVGRGKSAGIYFAFLNRSQGDEEVRQKILEFRRSLDHPLDLWLVGWAGRFRYLTGMGCVPDPIQRYWFGSLELYRCVERPGAEFRIQRSSLEAK